jgi:hypothetical protein
LKPIAGQHVICLEQVKPLFVPLLDQLPHWAANVTKRPRCHCSFKVMTRVVEAMDHIENAKEKLRSLKEINGQTLKKFLDSFEINGCFKGVCIVKTDGDDRKFDLFRRQFFQALHDNLTERFPCTARSFICCPCIKQRFMAD